MRPPIVWQEPSNWVAELRGRRYFRGLARRGKAQMAPAVGGEFDVRRGAAFVRIMPVDLIGVGRPFAGLVADVTADVLGLMPDYTPAMVAAHTAASTPESRAYWSDPEVLRGHATALQAATLIMTSWAELVDPLFEFANRPVVHVPDYHGVWGRAFRRGMRQVWRELEATLEQR